MPSSEVLKSLQARVAKASTEPGIYKWLNADGDVLYIGKAKNLRNRLKSYVPNAEDSTLGPWKRSLLEQIADFDIVVTTTELEALLLETNLIKQAKPRYNVLMKDDKHYVYVRISMQEDYPRIDLVRKMEDDGAKYFGPKTSAHAVREALSLLRTVFPFRTCNMSIEAGTAATDDTDAKIQLDVSLKNVDRSTPCLDYHIAQCGAPCMGYISSEEYKKQSIEPIVEFFKGNKKPFIDMLTVRMQQLAADKKFEQAATLRDQVVKLSEDDVQVASDTFTEDMDAIGIALFANKAQVVVLKRRGGKIVDESSFPLKGRADSEEDVLMQFVPQYYSAAAEIPGTVLVSVPHADMDILQEWLSTQRGKAVHLAVPERGKKSSVLDLAVKNAQEKARHLETKWESEARNAEEALSQLQQYLELPALPKRIEGYDISHLGGTETVGSMVVTRNGKAANDHYRNFSIRTMKGGEIDDYKALHEVLTRRLRYTAGGLKGEKARLAEQGITIKKALKKQRATVCELMQKYFDLQDPDTLTYTEYLLAHKENEIVGLTHMNVHDSGVQEIDSVWVEKRKDIDTAQLTQFLVRVLLDSHKPTPKERQGKKGKVYVIANPKSEALYAELGFRPIDAVPSALQKQFDATTDGIAMLYLYSEHKTDASLEAVPDLLVIDGGKGQLSTAVEVLKSLHLSIPVIGLAKREEEVFVPGQKVSVLFPPDSQAKFLLMRLRDEAHRFANNLRKKQGFARTIRSALDEVPGIGATTKKKLLKQFGSLEGIKQASDSELSTLLNEKQLQALRTSLQ